MKTLVIVLMVLVSSVWLQVWMDDQHAQFSDLPEPLRPHRPFWMVVLDHILGWVGVGEANGGPLGKFSPSFVRASLYAEDLKDLAERSTGFQDWGDPDGTFDEGLRVLGDALESEAKLTRLGRLLTWAQMKIILENRLKIVEYSKRYPKVNSQKIKSPIFIIGMPRSGTSFLHKLMAQDDEQFRSPLLWEINNPVPPTDPDVDMAEQSWETFFRFMEVKIGLSIFQFLAPKLASVHPLDPMNAEECMAIFGLDARSLLFNTLYHVPSYQKWLMGQSQLSPVLFHKRFLQTLQNGVDPSKPQKTWLLKTPWHMYTLQDLWKVYPDARIIMPHRDPAGMVASLSSLFARFYGIVTNDLNPKEIGQHEKRQWPVIISKFLETRNGNRAKANQIVDVHFEELVKNPLRAVEKIYEQLSIPLSERVKQRIQSFLNGTSGDGSGKKGAFGTHEYELEWFGLTEDELMDDPTFKNYCDIFDVPRKYLHSSEYGKTT